MTIDADASLPSNGRMRFRFTALLASSLVLLVPTAAHAVQASMCSAAEPTCERAPLSVSKIDKAPYDFDFDTGWLPNNSPVQVRLVAKLHSRVQVELEGTLDATWPEPLTLTPKGTKERGRISVDEGVEVEAQGRFSVTVAGNNYSWTGKIPGLPSVNLLAQRSQPFDPWAWKGQIPAASVTADTPTQKIAQIPLTDSIIPIPGISGGFQLDGAVSFSATYASLRIGFDEPNGPAAVTLQSPATRLLLTGTPAVDTSVVIHGELSRQMTLQFIPGFYFTILGKTFNLPIATIPLDLPASKPEPWDFDAVGVHIPLPKISDVADVDLGSIPLDAATPVLLAVNDLGEERLVLANASTHPFAFVDTVQATVDPMKGTNVRVVITPTQAGKFDVPVLLASNDPLKPLTQVHVRGFAGSGDVPGGGAPAPVDTASGCGCRVAGRSGGRVPAWLALGLVGLVMARRRRR